MAERCRIGDTIRACSQCADRSSLKSGRSLIEVLSLASGADETVISTHIKLPLKANTSASREAGLTEIVDWLIGSWLSGPSKVVVGVAAKHNYALAEGDQRVFAALIEGCLQFQIFLLQLGQIRLELQKSGVVSEQSLLSLEQLLQKRGGPLVDERGVSHGAHPLGDVARSGE